MNIIKFDNFRWSTYIDKISRDELRSNISLVFILSTFYGHYINIMAFMVLLLIRPKFEDFIYRMIITLILLLITLLDSNYFYFFYTIYFEILRLIIIILPELVRTIIQKINKDKYKMDKSIETLIHKTFKSFDVFENNFEEGASYLMTTIKNYITVKDQSDPIKDEVKRNIITNFSNLENMLVVSNENGISIFLDKNIVMLGFLQFKVFENKLTISEKKIICPICLEHKSEYYATNCKHSICIECSLRWFLKARTCPLCRMKIN